MISNVLTVFHNCEDYIRDSLQNLLLTKSALGRYSMPFGMNMSVALEICGFLSTLVDVLH